MLSKEKNIKVKQFKCGRLVLYILKKTGYANPLSEFRGLFAIFSLVKLFSSFLSDIGYLPSILIPHTKNLKRLIKSLIERWESSSKCQTTTVIKLDEEYLQRERKNNLIYDQIKRCRTSNPQLLTSRQPSEMELMLINLEIAENAQTITHLN